jgi:hypothetical protein
MRYHYTLHLLSVNENNFKNLKLNPSFISLLTDSFPRSLMTHLSKTCFPMSTDTFPFELAAALISGCMMCCWVKRASDVADDDQWGTEEAEPEDAAEEEGDWSGPRFCCQPEPGRK